MDCLLDIGCEMILKSLWKAFLNCKNTTVKHKHILHDQESHFFFKQTKKKDKKVKKSHKEKSKEEEKVEEHKDKKEIVESRKESR